MSLIDENFQTRIVDAIKSAEAQTSGEIRVHIQKHAKSDIISQAKQKFEQLRMSKTELKNGVLFFIAIEDKKFAVLGDKEIDDLVPDDFWSDTIETMKKYFQENDIPGGLEVGILTTGKALQQFFPYLKNDVNELTNEVSIDEKN